MLPDRLPFYFKVHAEKGNGGYPESLPFHLYFDDKLRIYRQRVDKTLEDTLRQVYELGGLVEGSLSTDSGKIYLDELLKYIDEQAGIAGKNILEVGCGSGVLLRELKNKKASVTGVEPGAYERADGTDDIRIIRDFFPSTHITDKFDVIVHFAIMEHIEDPVNFLIQQKSYLKPSGKIVISVPNCEPFLETGDISIFIHEHLSYFTREGVKNVVEKAGLFLQDIHPFEGVILATASAEPEDRLDNVRLNQLNAEKFESKISALNNNVIGIFSKYNEADVAVYVPFRSMNALFLANKVNPRLIDDNTQVKGKFLPCFNRRIENFDDLKNNPSRCILIYSRTFGDRIKEKCLKEKSLQSTEILTLNDLD